MLAPAIFAIQCAVILPSWSQAGPAAEGFERCRTIANDDLRLRCLRDLLAKEPERKGPVQPAWQLVRTPHPTGGADAVAIMRTADTGASDPDLAGAMIRCHEKRGLEFAVALIRPLPPRAKRNVVVAWGTSKSQFQAEALPPGTALGLPAEAIALAKGPWQAQETLEIRVENPDGEIRGVIPIGGLGAALAQLSANCPK